MVTILIERQKREEEREFSGKIRSLMMELSINPETVVVVKNGEVVSEEESCKDDDTLKFLSVISGG